MTHKTLSNHEKFMLANAIVNRMDSKAEGQGLDRLARVHAYMEWSRTIDKAEQLRDKYYDLSLADLNKELENMAIRKQARA